jgi:ankyrin repeat protein
MVPALIKHGADPNLKVKVPLNLFSEGKSEVSFPLLEASRYADSGTVSWLINSGAKVNSATENGVTPLMSAAIRGDRAIVDALLQAGADLNAEDKEHRNAISYAKLSNAPEKDLIIAKITAAANRMRSRAIHD